MDTFVIEGGKRLFGRVRVNGSKNSALPLLAAASRPGRWPALPRLLSIGVAIAGTGWLGARLAELAG